MSEALPKSLAEPRSRFFVTMAALLVALVFVGFAPTFYLKAFFTTRELHWLVQLHAVVLTIWCGLFLTQNVLVTIRRTATHRRLGVLAGATAVLVVLMTIYVIAGADARTATRGAPRVQPIENLVLGDLSLLVSFVVLTSVGFSLRRRPAQHKRAMLMANIALITPALGRIALFPGFSEIGPGLVPVVVLSLLLSIWVHDWLTDKRLHSTTVWGSALVFGSMLAGAAIANTEAGKAFVAEISLGSS